MDIKKKAGSIKEVLSGSTAIAAKYRKAIVILLVGVFMIVAGNIIINLTKSETPDIINHNTAKPQNTREL